MSFRIKASIITIIIFIITWIFLEAFSLLYLTSSDKYVDMMFANKNKLVYKLKVDEGSVMCHKQSLWNHIYCIGNSKEGRPITFTCTIDMCKIK